MKMTEICNYKRGMNNKNGRNLKYYLARKYKNQPNFNPHHNSIFVPLSHSNHNHIHRPDQKKRESRCLLNNSQKKIKEKQESKVATLKNQTPIGSWYSSGNTALMRAIPASSW